MKMRSRISLVGISALATLLVAPACYATTVPTTTALEKQIVTLQGQVKALQTAKPATTTYTNNPWKFMMSTATPNANGLEIHQSSNAGAGVQDFEIFDGTGAPIVAVGVDGGVKVFGDDVSAYGGVLSPEVVMHGRTRTASQPAGSITIGASGTPITIQAVSGLPTSACNLGDVAYGINPIATYRCTAVNVWTVS